MTDVPRGEPWFFIGLGGFGARVAERLEAERRVRSGWEPPALSLRLEAGAEQRRPGPAARSGADRRVEVESLRFDVEDPAPLFRAPGDAGEGGEGYEALRTRLRAAFLDVYGAKEFVRRRPSGDDRPVGAAVAIALDLTDPFGREGVAATIDVLARLTRETLGPLFRKTWRNLEVLVVATAPIADAGPASAAPVRSALDRLEAMGPALGVGQEGETDLRVFLQDDRSDRYVLTEADRAEQATLFIGTLLGCGPAASDAFREIRSPAGERGRRARWTRSMFGTFSAASLGYPGGTVDRYCRLRQLWEVLQVFADRIDEQKSDVKADEESRRWVEAAAARLEQSFREALSEEQAAIDARTRTQLAFTTNWPPVPLGLLTPHVRLGDPNHYELGFAAEAPYLERPGDVPLRIHPPGGAPNTGPLDRQTLGVRTEQPANALEEQPPVPVIPPPIGTWVGGVDGFIEDTLHKNVPIVIGKTDVSSNRLVGASRAELRASVDGTLASSLHGLPEARDRLLRVMDAVRKGLETARREFGGATMPPRRDDPAALSSMLARLLEFRRRLELRELFARAGLYAALGLAAWTALLYRPAGVFVGEAIPSAWGVAAVVLAAGLLAFAAPMAWDLWRSWVDLRFALERLGAALLALRDWLVLVFFKTRVDLDRRLWRVRWLRLLEDEVAAEQRRLDRVRANLMAALDAVRLELQRLGVRFSRSPDGKEIIDDSRVIGADGLFQRWILPGGPIGSVYARHRDPPEKLAALYLEQHRPYAAWRAVVPFSSIEALERDIVRRPPPSEDENPFATGLGGEAGEAAKAFLAKFATAARAPLAVRALWQSPDPQEARREDEEALDWTVVVSAPEPLVGEVEALAAAVGLPTESGGAGPRDRITVLRALVNVERERIDDLLPALAAPAGAPEVRS